MFQPGKEKLKLKPVDVKKMLERNKEQMFLCESEAIEFIRDIYDTYSGANRLSEKHAANQMDFEVLAEKQEKRLKQKMAIVKEDCESFDIMPLSEAEKQGKKVLKATKIDYFLASFSGGKDSQVVLDLCTRALPPDASQVNLVVSKMEITTPNEKEKDATISKMETVVNKRGFQTAIRLHQTVAKVA